MAINNKNETDIQVALLHKDFADMKTEIEELRADVKGLVDAWKTAEGIVAFVKWLAGLATAFAIVWAAVKMKIGA